MVLGLFHRDHVLKNFDTIGKYTVEKVIGEGRYGICYQVNQGDQRYIVKQLKRGMLKKSGKKSNYEEEILKILQHGNIPKYIEKIQLKDFYGYVLELKMGKTFEEIIYQDKHVFQRDEIINIAWQLVEVLKHLHAKGVVHRDIRVPNVLLDKQKVNVVDFGLARRINDVKYKADVDFAFLGDFLLHLYYTAYSKPTEKKVPWYKELSLTQGEMHLLKRLLGADKRYQDILEVEADFNKFMK